MNISAADSSFQRRCSRSILVRRTLYARVALLAAVAMAAVAAGACAAECRGAGAQLSATSARNATGHLVTTVRLQRETRLGAGNAPVALDVNAATTLCKGARTDALVLTLHTPPPPPGAGYEEFQGIGFYKLHEEHKTWDEAKAACEDEDAHLLVLNSEAEATAIQQLIRRHPTPQRFYFFIGFHDRDKEGHYVTIFGEELASTGFLRWEAGQPNNMGDEDCGTMSWKPVEFDDRKCTDKQPFICEYNFASS